MKNRKLILLLFLTPFFFQSCSNKINTELKEVQDSNYSTSWKEMTTYSHKARRSDDLYFFSPSEGLVINSQGYLSYTQDGGDSWEVIYENKGTFFRCITFNNRLEGWLGTIGTGDQHIKSKDTIALYETKDGGLNWSPVKFRGPTPKGLCGLQKVTDKMIVGAGRVRGPSFFIKTMDGGDTWFSYDLNHLAGSLIATHFLDEEHGFLIGGTTQDKENSRSLVLETLDGGMSWDTIYLSKQTGEYPWKFSFPTKETGYISIQRNIRDGRFYYLVTNDGGKTWNEQEYAPDYYYTQGIGFVNENLGWIGGSNSATYETRDGGNHWMKIKNIGKGFNNFQFFGDTLAYGVGFGVFKYFGNQNPIETFHEELYSEGELRARYKIKDGKRNGLAVIFYQNGRVESQGNYKNNLKNGKWKYYNESGELSYESVIKNGIYKLPKKTLQSYVGTYLLENGTTRNVLIENDQLYTQRGKGKNLLLFPENEGKFYYKFNPDVTIEFIKDNQGQVVATKSFQRGKYSTAIKS